MPLGSYGLLVGKLVRHERDTPDNQGRWFHVNVFVSANGTEYHCAIDVDSKQSAIGVEWKILELRGEDWKNELALSEGCHTLDSTDRSGALDYMRSGRLSGGTWSRGSAQDAATALESLLDPSGQTLLVFGEPFSGHGVGIHNIHQNQGDPAGTQWWDDNAPWQDGATIIQRSDGTLVAFLNKFTSQTYETDKEGHAPYHPPRPTTGRLQQIWGSSTASLVAIAPPTVEKGEIERHRIYGLVVLALVAHYWNGNKRGREGRYPWRQGQLVNGQYQGGDYLGHNIACVAADDNGQIIDFDFNHNDLFQSSVEHAESRLIRRIFSLTQLHDGWALRGNADAGQGYATQLSRVTVYTSLESCAQCSGIMALGSVRRVVFLQRDPGQNSIGNILYNLAEANASFRAPLPMPANLLGIEYFDRLAKGYDEFVHQVRDIPFYVGPDNKQDRSASITSYLCTDGPLAICRAAQAELSTFQVAEPAYQPKGDDGAVLASSLTNAELLTHARAFLEYAQRLGRRGTPHQI